MRFIVEFNSEKESFFVFDRITDEIILYTRKFEAACLICKALNYDDGAIEWEDLKS